MANRTQRFGVGDPTGARPSEWFVFWKTNANDVYLGSRALGGNLKVSLHQSGQCHIRAPDPSRWMDADRPPPFLERWTIDPGSTYQFPFGVIVPCSELRAGNWGIWKDKGTIWIPATNAEAIQIGVFLTRLDPIPVDQIVAAGWLYTIVSDVLPDGRTLSVLAGPATLDADRRAQLDAIKARAHELAAAPQGPPRVRRLAITTGPNEPGTRNFVDAALD